jgi:arabinan endo-1,5-alpha-L-arabinosidase
MKFSNRVLVSLLVSVLLISGGMKVALAQHTPPTFQNPVLAEDFPDPDIIRLQNGTFVAYGTNGFPNGQLQHIQGMVSSDLLHWKRFGDVLPQLPAWGNTSTLTWAPEVIHLGNKYVLYYAAAQTGTKMEMGIGTAVSNSPFGPFVATGTPLRTGPWIEEIDPHPYLDDDGKLYLFWGSGFKPIRGQEMNADGLTFKSGTTPTDLVFPHPNLPNGYEKLYEGAFVIKRGGYYYMFYSGDDCYGYYEVRVARSSHPLGPWITLGDAKGLPSSAILKPSARWRAPGHNSIFTDDAGRDWILYHAIDMVNVKFTPRQEPVRELLMEPIAWVEGWPQLRTGMPTDQVQYAPVIHSRR